MNSLISNGRRNYIYIVAILSILIGLFSITTVAQEEEPNLPNNQTAPDNRPRNNNRLQLLPLLNLTREQRRQIQLIRRETEPLRRAAVQRVRLAQRALNNAIYDDSGNEALVEQRVGELSIAQRELIRLRSLTELKIRRLLTPEQLAIFRNLRQEAIPKRRAKVRRLRP
jgi:Spy/CpxP family protein refolding chaperone